jgi:hypothetical protein
VARARRNRGAAGARRAVRAPRGAFDDDALAAAREASARGEAGEPGARALLEWIVEQRTAAALAPLDERELAWERSAAVRSGDGRAVPYGAVDAVLADTSDRAERLLWDEARARLVGAELAPLRRERLTRERELVDGLGLGDGYVATFAALSGIDVRALADACDRLLADTAAMWDDVSRRSRGVGWGSRATSWARAELPALLRAREWDAALGGGAMVATVRAQLAAMGVDATVGGRVRVDVGARAGKRARAFCAPVRIPEEVHLVVRATGGVGDWRAFLHEQGHALHLAHTRADLPLEARWGGDASVGEGYALLLGQLLLDRGWLMRYAGLDRAGAAALARSAAFEELHLLRRHAAKLRYELALLDGTVPWGAVGELYVETLGRATGVRHRAEDALVDMWTRVSTRRATYAAGSCRGRSVRRCASASTRTGGAIQGPDRGWCASAGARGRARTPPPWRGVVAGGPLDSRRTVRALEQALA